MKKYEFKIKHFEANFKITDNSGIFTNISDEWSNYTESVDKSYFNELFISSETMNLAFREYIFQYYIKSLIEYDIFNGYLLINDDMREISNKYIGSASSFSDYITYFKNSFQIYTNGFKRRYRMPLTCFQRRFYDFLSGYGIIQKPNKRLIYAVPEHFAPLFICIIMSWNLSPIAQPNATINKTVSFYKFKQRVLDQLCCFKFLDNAYRLHAEYFLHHFFDSQYLKNSISNFNENGITESLMRNEVKNYRNALDQINNSIPFLFLKKAYINFADFILENNMQSIIKPEIEYTEVTEITDQVNQFFAQLKKITIWEQKITENIMIEYLSEYSYKTDKTIKYISKEKKQEYFLKLRNTVYHYNNCLIGYYSDLYYYFNNFLYKVSKLNEIRYISNIDQIKSDIKEFISTTYKLLYNKILEHEKLINDGEKAINKDKKNESPNTDTKIAARLFEIDTRYKKNYIEILENMEKLQKNLNKIIPVQLMVKKNPEIIYDVLINEIYKAVDFYNRLFTSFYYQIRPIGSDIKNAFCIFQTYINTHAKNILNDLLPDSK